MLSRNGADTSLDLNLRTLGEIDQLMDGLKIQMKQKLGQEGASSNMDVHLLGFLVTISLQFMTMSEFKHCQAISYNKSSWKEILLQIILKSFF